MKQSFEFEARLTVKEMWLFSIYHSYRGMYGILNLFITASAVFILITRGSEFSRFYQMLLAAVALTFTIFQPLLLWTKAYKRSLHPVFRKPMKMCFDPEKLTVYQGREQMEITWEQVMKIEAGIGMIIIYTNPVHGFLLPNMVFNEQRMEFTEFLKQVVPKGKCKRI